MRPRRDTTRRIGTNARTRPTFTIFAEILIIPSRGLGSLRTTDKETRDILHHSSMHVQTKIPTTDKRSPTGGVSGTLTRHALETRRLSALGSQGF